MCTFSYVCTIFLVCLDLKEDMSIYVKNIISSKTVVQEEKSIKEIQNLPRIFFLIVFYCMFMYSGILPFNYIATSFLIKTW